MYDAVIVQTLWTRWSKAYRGAPFSAKRNTTPETFDLEPSCFADRGASWHDVVFSGPGFAPVETYRSRNLPADFHRVSVLVQPESGGVTVELFGQPCFRLQPGQSGKVLYNLSEDLVIDGWRDTEFHKVVFHIALAIPARSDMFRGAPDRTHVSLRDLT